MQSLSFSAYNEQPNGVKKPFLIYLTNGKYQTDVILQLGKNVLYIFCNGKPIRDSPFEITAMKGVCQKVKGQFNLYFCAGIENGC